MSLKVKPCLGESLSDLTTSLSIAILCAKGQCLLANLLIQKCKYADNKSLLQHSEKSLSLSTIVHKSCYFMIQPLWPWPMIFGKIKVKVPHEPGTKSSLAHDRHSLKISTKVIHILFGKSQTDKCQLSWPPWFWKASVLSSTSRCDSADLYESEGEL